MTPIPKKETERFIQKLPGLLATGKRLRLSLPGGGILHVDRTLPFLYINRRPPDRIDAGTDALVRSESVYMVAPGGSERHTFIAGIAQAVIKTVAQEFGAFLVLEVWSDPEQETSFDSPLPDTLTPGFAIAIPEKQLSGDTVRTLARSLKGCILDGRRPEVRVEPQRRMPAPPGLRPLFTQEFARRNHCHFVGISVRPVYREANTREVCEVFPGTLRRLRRAMSRAVRQALFHFTDTQTAHHPPHYHALGPRAVTRAVLEADRRLSGICDAFDYLLQVTPVNAHNAWLEFRRHRSQRPPEFMYRPMPFEMAEMKRLLFQVPVERVGDPALSHLFREKQAELDRMISLVADCGTRRFLPESIQLFGGVDETLKGRAVEVLETVRARPDRQRRSGTVDAQALLGRIHQELNHYQQTFPGFTQTAQIRTDMPEGMLVSRGELFVGAHTRMPAERVDALVQHEVGVHLVTFSNGANQPLRLLSHGLAGYEAFQEGLAVLAEYLTGGLTAARLRLLAARVLAVESVIRGGEFMDTYRLLNREHGLSQRAAFIITMRVHRGGGLTKDAVYLRGFLDVLRTIPKYPDSDMLFIGKMAASHLPIVRELTWRKVLRTPLIRPRFMDLPGVAEKLRGLTPDIPLQKLVV